MNRIKKEIRKKGFKLENDYPYLPFKENSVVIEGVTFDSENCLLYQHSVVGTLVLGFDRKMNHHMVNFY